MLTFEPLEKIGVPKDWEMFKNWYMDCITSTGFKAGKSDWQNIVFEDEKLNEELKRREIIYNKFVEERTNQIN